MKRIKLILLVFAVLCALSATGLVMAQSSVYNDLGCWGVLTNGGARRQSATAIVKDAIGQTGGGLSQSATVQLRAGYSQNWSGLYPRPTPTPRPTLQPITSTTTTYMPLVSRFVRTIRACR